MVDLNKQDALAFLVDTTKGDVKSQLLEAARTPVAPATEPVKSDPKAEPAPVHKTPVDTIRKVTQIVSW